MQNGVVVVQRSPFTTAFAYASKFYFANNQRADVVDEWGEQWAKVRYGELNADPSFILVSHST